MCIIIYITLNKQLEEIKVQIRDAVHRDIVDERILFVAVAD